MMLLTLLALVIAVLLIFVILVVFPIIYLLGVDHVMAWFDNPITQILWGLYAIFLFRIIWNAMVDLWGDD